MMELPEAPYRFGKFVLDTLNLRLTADGQICALEPKSFRLLQFLIENRHRVVPKDEILNTVWDGVAVSDNALTRAIAQIRKALDDDPKQPRYIETVPTVGYRFAAVVEVGAVPVVTAPPAAALPAPARSRSRFSMWGAVAVAVAAAGVGATRLLGPASPDRAPSPSLHTPAMRGTRAFRRMAIKSRSPGPANMTIIPTSM